LEVTDSLEETDYDEVIITVQSITLEPSHELKGKCKRGEWTLDVEVDGVFGGRFVCKEGEDIRDVIGLPAGSGTVKFTASGPDERECTGAFSYKQDLDKFKLECKDGEKRDKVEAKFEIKRMK
jgi:hypothetical protein